MKPKNKKFGISTSYGIDSHIGMDPELDKVIEKAVGKKASSFGSGFGERDLQFGPFKSRGEAIVAARTILDLEDYRTISVAIYPW